ncbi:MAG TPA: WG repeat-containing protein [Pyrinomonadaceae bacterium]|nr:WG repeat-containing protein [Pyrinomonadaceae bacterium]
MMKSSISALLFLVGCVSLIGAQQVALFPIEKNGKTGYIDVSGRVIIKPQFDDGWPFNEGVAPVRVGDDWGYIDATGKIVIKPQFFQAKKFSNGIASVGVWFPQKQVITSKVGFYNYIDRKGQLISKDQFEVAFSFADGLAQVLTWDYKNGIIDTNGTLKFYFDIYNAGFSNGLAMFKTNGNMPDTKVGYIDKSGKIAIPPTFDYGEDFSEGLACVSSGNGSGFVDSNGKIAIGLKVDGWGRFYEGLAPVLVNGLGGFIDKTGKMVIPPQFAWNPGKESRFSDGVAVVKIGESEKPTKDGLRNVTITPDRNIMANSSGLYGVIDKTGKFVMPPKYVQLGDFENGLAWVNLSDAYIIHGDTNRWGYINKQGKIVWKSF